LFREVRAKEIVNPNDILAQEDPAQHRNREPKRSCGNIRMQSKPPVPHNEDPDEQQEAQITPLDDGSEQQDQAYQEQRR
jgi:hypothetical protein